MDAKYCFTDILNGLSFRSESWINQPMETISRWRQKRGSLGYLRSTRIECVKPCLLVWQALSFGKGVPVYGSLWKCEDNIAREVVLREGVGILCWRFLRSGLNTPKTALYNILFNVTVTVTAYDNFLARHKLATKSAFVSHLVPRSQQSSPTHLRRGMVIGLTWWNFTKEMWNGG